MDSFRMSQLIVLGGHLWALAASVASVIVATGVQHGLAPHKEIDLVMIERAAYIGFGISIATCLVGSMIVWGSTQIRAWALGHYEVVIGFPFVDEAQNGSRSIAAVLEALTIWPFGFWFFGSGFTIYYLEPVLKKYEIFDRDYMLVLSFGAQISNALTSVWYALVVFTATGDREVVARARIPQLVPRAADAGQARQDVIDEPMRHFESILRQRSRRPRFPVEEVHSV